MTDRRQLGNTHNTQAETLSNVTKILQYRHTVVFVVNSTLHTNNVFLIYTASQKTRHYTPVRNFAKC